MCKYESLKNGDVSIEDLLDMHDALDLQQWIETESMKESK